LQLIRAAALSDFVSLAQAYSLDPYALVREVGLDRNCLIDPDLKISIKTLDQLLELSAAHAGIDDFGLRLAEKRSLSNLGPVSLVLREEPDLRRFLNSVVRYIYLHNEAIHVHVSSEAPTINISIQFLVDGWSMGRQSMELAVGVLFRSLQAIMGRDWSPWSVCLTHAPPKSFEAHHRIFGSKVAFLQDFDGIMIRATDLDRPAVTADPMMARYARQYLESLNSGGQEQLVGKVRQLVTLLLPAGRCTIETVSKYLGIDRRTIHRQLLHSETTFSEIVSEVRKEQVIRYLTQGFRSLAETTDMLGFSGQSAFSRWFKQTFGMTAQAWRAKQKSSVANNK
jgi:AraC-like DNA-binding protein